MDQDSQTRPELRVIRGSGTHKNTKRELRLKAAHQRVMEAIETEREARGWAAKAIASVDMAQLSPDDVDVVVAALQVLREAREESGDALLARITAKLDRRYRRRRPQLRAIEGGAS